MGHREGVRDLLAAVAHRRRGLSQRGVRAPLLVAVDGGNSKTHLALAGGDGELLALVRGPLSTPDELGVDGCVAVLDALLDEALASAGLARGEGPVAAVAEVLLAGADQPDEVDALQEAIGARGWADRLRVANDTFALLRAGARAGRDWGVAVVCGAGINCVGVAPDGREARFAALGELSGDWGGGYDLGLGALAAAVRSADGRGPRTALEADVPAHFGLSTPDAVALALHRGAIDAARLAELAPLVLAAAAARDRAARGLVERLAVEVAAFARAALTRLDLLDEKVDVVAGGGLLRREHANLLRGVRRELKAAAPHARVVVCDEPPIVGSALLALDALGADPAAHRRLRAALSEAAGAV